MKVTLCFLLLIGNMHLLAQQSSISGIVSILNSETQTGKRQYVSNAQVEDDFKKATSTTTNINGQFKLVYVGINEKASVSFQVKKTGLQVVNTDALFAIAGQDDIKRISMAAPDSIAEYRRKIYNIGKTEAEKYLEQLVTRKSRELNDLKKNSVQNKSKINQLEQELSLVEEQRRKIDEQAQDLAKRYAPVNLDDAPALFKEVFGLFQKGNLDAAQLLLKQADLPGKVVSILSERNKIGNLKTELIKRDSLQKETTDNVAKALQLKADLHKTRYEFDSVSKCYELLIMLDTLNISYMFNYASFLHWLTQYDKAINYYLKVLKLYTANTVSLQAYNPDLATTQNNLGILYLAKNDYVKAEKAFLEALEIRKRLTKVFLQIYEPDVAMTQNNLGTLYRTINNYDKAETAYLEASAVYARLAKVNPQTFEQISITVKNNLGVLYGLKNDYNKAIPALQEVLKVRKLLAKTNPQTYEFDLATTQHDLGNLYYNINDYSKAEEAYLEALEIRDRLANINPQTYEPHIATLQTDLGSLYYKKNNYNKAEEAFTKALEISRRLAKVNPQTYEPNIAIAQNNLGNLYSKKRDNVKAERAFLEALEINRRFALFNPRTFDLALAITQNNIGTFYSTQTDYVKAERAFLEALEVYKRLANANPQTFEPDLATIQNNLGVLYHLKKDFVSAEKPFLAALEIVKHLASINPQSYEPDIAMIQSNLGSLYNDQKDYVKAEEAFLEALKVYNRLAKDDPQTYEPKIAWTKNQFGKLSKNKKDYVKAEAAYREALELYKRLAKVDTQIYEPEIAMTQNDLGTFYLMTKQYGQAENILIQSLFIFEKWMTKYPQLYTSEVSQTAKNLLYVFISILDTLKYDSFSKLKEDNFKIVENTLNNQSKKDTLVAQILSGYYGSRSWYLLFASKFTEAEQSAKKGLSLEPTYTWIKTNLAHSLLFQNRYEDALKKYQELKSLKNEEGKSYAAICLEDLDELEKNGVTNKDLNKIRQFLKE